MGVQGLERVEGRRLRGVEREDVKVREREGRRERDGERERGGGGGRERE